MRATKYFFFSICLFLATGIFAQTAPAIQWQKCLGGLYNDEALSFQQTADGGYIMAGWSESNDGDVSGNHINQYNTGYSHDYWVVKLDATRHKQWEKSLGGTGTEIAWSIQQTTDGGYIVAGYSDSHDNGDVFGNHNYQTDIWVVKLDAAGNIQWQKCLGGTNNENAYSIQQTADGGYIVAGSSSSKDGDVTGNHAAPPNSVSGDAWVVKLDASGNIQWQKSLGGSGNDLAQSICQTADGGYVMAGFSTSNDGDVSGNHGSNAGGGDAWIAKLGVSGNLQWQKCLGGSGDDYAQSVKQTTDGGYIMAGGSSSNDGDVSGNHGGNADYWLVKLDRAGNIQWQKCLGGTQDEVASSVRQTADGGYIVAGHSNSNDGDVNGNHSSYNDAWVVKLSAPGDIQWQKCLGGTYDEGTNSIEQTVDGGYIVVGSSDSNNDGDVSGNHGYPLGTEDYWIVKLDADIVLPLRLVSFSGTLENNSTKLNWKQPTK